MIRITSKQEGFRRCGIAHSVKPTEYPNDKFTNKQFVALKEEPMLVVEVLPDKKVKGEKNGEDNK
jgi:hypothetical protein